MNIRLTSFVGAPSYEQGTGPASQASQPLRRSQMTTRAFINRSLCFGAIVLAFACFGAVCESAPQNPKQGKQQKGRQAAAQPPASATAAPVDVSHLPWRPEMGALLELQAPPPSSASV